MIRKLFVQSLKGLLATVGVVAGFSLLLIVLRPYLSTAVVALLYLVPVVISAALWGRLPGIGASILSFFTLLYFFIPPFNTLRVTHPQDLLVMVVLLGVAVLISSLMARVQTNLRQVQAREREVTQLYSLSTSLLDRNDLAAVAGILARGLADVFQPERVEVEVLLPDQPLTVRLPDQPLETDPIRHRPSHRLPLVTARGRLGEVRLWNAGAPLAPEYERLLQTFLNQGAMALDRTLLAESETRARVLEESDRIKTAILSSVSHELRTPLASIQAAATSLFNPAVALEPAARAELQDVLLEETERLTELVGNLLNLSRIEAGALKLQRQWNAFAEIVDSAARKLRRVAGDHALEIAVSEDLPLVSVDAVLMETVMVNLIRNSLKYASPGAPVRVQAGAGETALHIVVSNDGPPIPEESLDRVFEKFYPMPGRDSTQSTGLGLSICKGVVEAHGGAIWAANLRPGVAFHVTLPLDWAGVRPVMPEEEGETP